jgi:predicted dehydrogenase
VKPIRLAVVGVGHLGRIHARLAAALDAYQLVGVVDPDEANRQQVSAQVGAPAFRDYREVLDCVDAAVIATPTRLHHAVAGDFLARGVHVLVEKPLVATAREASDLVAAARRSQRVLQVGHVERFNPAWTKALAHLRAPRYIEAVRAGSYSFRSTDIGVVLDLMIHDLDLILSLVPAPLVNVEAVGMSLLGRHEDLANARLTFADGCVATISASRVSSQPVRSMQIWTERCLASLDFATRTGTLIRPSEAVLRREIDVEKLTPVERLQLKDHLADHLPVERIEAQPIDAITAELQDFSESIRTGRMPRVSGEQAQRAVEVAEQIVEAIAHQASSQEGLEQIPFDGPNIIPSPHFLGKLARQQNVRREAG